MSKQNPNTTVTINNENKETSIAIIGSGPCCLGVLWGFKRRIEELENETNKSEDELKELEKLKKTKFAIFEKSSIIGTGFPYDNSQFDPEHILNIEAVSTYIPGRKDVTKKTEEFFQYLIQNKIKLEKTVDDIFFKRQEVIFERHFRAKYNQEDYERIMEGKKDDLSQEDEDKRKFFEYRNRIRQHFKDHYLDFNDKKDVEAKNKLYPRIFYGMYQMQMFHDTIRELTDMGVVVEEYPNTEVIDLDEKASVTFEQRAKNNLIDEKRFDQVVLATGRFYVEPTEEEQKLKRYISNPWPASKLENLIDEEIRKREERKDENKVINIAIEGSGLSAIDIVKTIFKDVEYDENGIPNIEQCEEYKGYKIEVTMILRSNNLRVVCAKDEDINLKMLSEEDIEKKIDSNGNGKIYLWQVIELLTQKFVDHCNENYGNPDYDQKSIEYGIQQGKLLLSLINNEKSKDLFQYDKILEHLEQISTSMGGETPEENLEINLNLAKSEKINAYTILLNILDVTISSITDKLPLPKDEKVFFDAFSNIYERVIIGPLPYESAKLFFNLNRNEVLKFKQIGNDQKLENEDESIQYDNDKNHTKFAFIISAKGNPVDITQDPSSLSQNMLKRGIFTTNDILVGDVDEKKEAVEEKLLIKFGESAERIIGKLKVIDGNVIYKNNSLNLDKNKHPIDENGVVNKKIWSASNQTDGISEAVISGVGVIEGIINQLIARGKVERVQVDNIKEL